jgi:hypothetical protein
MFGVGAVCEDAAGQLRLLLPVLDEVRTELLAVLSGATAQAAAPRLAQLYDGGPYSLHHLAEALEAVGAAAHESSTHIRATKEEDVSLLAVAASEIMYALAMLWWTLGASASWIPVIESFTIEAAARAAARVANRIRTAIGEAFTKTGAIRNVRHAGAEVLQETGVEFVRETSVQAHLKHEGLLHALSGKQIFFSAGQAAAGGGGAGALHHPWSQTLGEYSSAFAKFGKSAATQAGLGAWAGVLGTAAAGAPITASAIGSGVASGAALGGAGGSAPHHDAPRTTAAPPTLTLGAFPAPPDLHPTPPPTSAAANDHTTTLGGPPLTTLGGSDPTERPSDATYNGAPTTTRGADAAPNTAVGAGAGIPRGGPGDTTPQPTLTRAADAAGGTGVRVGAQPGTATAHAGSVAQFLGSIRPDLAAPPTTAVEYHTAEQPATITRAGGHGPRSGGPLTARTNARGSTHAGAMGTDAPPPWRGAQHPAGSATNSSIVAARAQGTSPGARVTADRAAGAGDARPAGTEPNDHAALAPNPSIGQQLITSFDDRSPHRGESAANAPTAGTANPPALLATESVTRRLDPPGTAGLHRVTDSTIAVAGAGVAPPWAGGRPAGPQIEQLAAVDDGRDIGTGQLARIEVQPARPADSELGSPAGKQELVSVHRVVVTGQADAATQDRLHGSVGSASAEVVINAAQQTPASARAHAVRTPSSVSSGFPRLEDGDPRLVDMETVSQWLARVNVEAAVGYEQARSQNCGQIALATFEYLKRVPSFQVAGHGSMAVLSMSEATGLRQWRSDPGRIEALLRAQGPGAHTVIAVLRGGDGVQMRTATSAHFFNVVVDTDGNVRTLDGQTGQIIEEWPPDFNRPNEPVTHWLVSVPPQWTSLEQGLPAATATGTAGAAMLVAGGQQHGGVPLTAFTHARSAADAHQAAPTARRAQAWHDWERPVDAHDFLTPLTAGSGRGDPHSGRGGGPQRPWWPPYHPQPPGHGRGQPHPPHPQYPQYPPHPRTGPHPQPPQAPYQSSGPALWRPPVEFAATDQHDPRTSHGGPDQGAATQSQMDTGFDGDHDQQRQALLAEQTRIQQQAWEREQQMRRGERASFYDSRAASAAGHTWHAEKVRLAQQEAAQQEAARQAETARRAQQQQADAADMDLEYADDDHEQRRQARLAAQAHAWEREQQMRRGERSSLYDSRAASAAGHVSQAQAARLAHQEETARRAQEAAGQAETARRAQQQEVDAADMDLEYADDDNNPMHQQPRQSTPSASKQDQPDPRWRLKLRLQTPASYENPSAVLPDERAAIKEAKRQWDNQRQREERARRKELEAQPWSSLMPDELRIAQEHAVQLEEKRRKKQREDERLLTSRGQELAKKDKDTLSDSDKVILERYERRKETANLSSRKIRARRREEEERRLREWWQELRRREEEERRRREEEERRRREEEDRRRREG